MPRANQFRHQAYTASPPAAPHCLVTPGPHPPVGSEEFQRRMDRVGAALDSAGVAAVYLAHGTFVGPDALGVLAELARVFPKAGTAVRRVIKRIVDKITGEVGNYTGQFAQCFESAINRPDRPPIPVRRFALVEREPSSRPRRRRRAPDRRTGRPPKLPPASACCSGDTATPATSSPW